MATGSKGDKSVRILAAILGVVLLIAMIAGTACAARQYDFDTVSTAKTTTSTPPPRDKVARIVTTTKGVEELESRDELDRLLASDEPFAVLVHASWCVHCKSMKPDFARASDACPGVRFAQIEAKVVGGREIGTVRIDAYPLLVVRTVGPVKSNSGRMSYSQIVSLARLSSTHESTPSSSSASSSPVEDIETSERLDELIRETFGERTSVAVNVYSKRCGFSQKFLPEWHKAAQIAANETIPAKFVQVESDDWKAFPEVREYPSVVIFTPNPLSNLHRDVEVIVLPGYKLAHNIVTDIRRAIEGK